MKSLTHNWLKNILKAKYLELQKLDSKNLLVEDTLKVIKAELKPEYQEYTYSSLMPYSFLFPYINKLAQIPNDEFLNTNLMPNLTLKQEDLLELVHDFFQKNTSQQFYQDFMHFFKKRKTHLHFYPFTNDDCSNTTYLPFYREAYIQIYLQHEFLDIPIIAHEYAHNIQYLNNYSKNLFTRLKPFIEIVSTFIELICTEYYTEHGFTKIGIITQFEELDYILESIKNLNTEISTKQKPKSILDCSTFIYDIAWQVATNLFQIYLNDPNKSFYLLYKIINLDLSLDAKTYFQELEKLGLTTTEGLATYNNYIKRKLTRI